VRVSDCCKLIMEVSEGERNERRRSAVELLNPV
jgi:hypothetical protein